MDLIRPEDIPHRSVERSIGTSRVQCVLAFVLSASSVYLLYRFGLAEFVSLHWLVQVVAAPVLLLGLLLWFVVTHAMWQGMRGAFGAGNWILKTSGEHLFLNLRCYANFDLGDVGPTVVRIHYREVESAGKLRESFEVSNSDAARVSCHLEIRLRHTDTDALREAVRAEAAAEAPVQRFGLFTMRARSTMRPVVVTAPGVIRAAWRGRKMLRALERRVDVVEPRRHVLADPADRHRGSEADDRILELVERGDHMAAVELVRDAYSMSLTEADQFLAELEGRRAAPVGAAE